jgi:hypothetical protein
MTTTEEVVSTVLMPFKHKLEGEISSRLEKTRKKIIMFLIEIYKYSHNSLILKEKKKA